jgi:hypothetical protein
VRDRLSAGTRPPENPSRVTRDHRVRRHVPRHHGTRTDQCTPSDTDRRNERRPRADARPVVHEGLLPLGGAWECRAGISDVREDGAGANEDVLSQRDSRPHTGVALQA